VGLIILRLGFSSHSYFLCPPGLLFGAPPLGADLGADAGCGVLAGCDAVIAWLAGAPPACADAAVLVCVEVTVRDSVVRVVVVLCDVSVCDAPIGCAMAAFAG
jgi:hypothetical protein